MREESVAELLRPVELVAHRLKDIGKLDQRLNARVPILGLKGLYERIAFEFGVRRLLSPARSLDHIERVGRSHEHVGQEIIGIERDGREELIQFLFFQLSVLRKHRGHGRLETDKNQRRSPNDGSQ